MSEPTVIRVATASPYDVVVGDGPARPAARPRGRRRAARGAGLPRRPARRRRRRSATSWPRRYDVLDLAVPPGEQAKTAEVAARCWEALGAAGFTRSDAVRHGRRGSDDRPGWLRGGDVAARRARRARPDDPAGHGRRRGGRQDGDQHQCRQEPRGLVPRAGRRAVRPRPARVPAGGGAAVGARRGRQVRLHRRPRDPASWSSEPRPPTSSPGRRWCASWSSARCGSRPTSWPATSASEAPTARHPGREVLNYGHTMGHAVELASDFTLRHGEAVAIGCVYVAELARAAGILDDDVADRHHTAFARAGLPTGWSGAPYDDLRARMAVDKKARGSSLRFVVLDALAQPADPGRPERGRPAGGVRRDGGRRRDEGARAQRSQPGAPRAPPAGDLRLHDVRRAGGAVRRVGPRRSGSRSRSGRPTTRVSCSTG